MVIAFWDFFDFLPFFYPNLKGMQISVHELLYQLPNDLRLRSLWYEEIPEKSQNYTKL